jgi:hypothetical protein
MSVARPSKSDQAYCLLFADLSRTSKEQSIDAAKGGSQRGQQGQSSPLIAPLPVVDSVAIFREQVFDRG